jgi:hypothetical protein
VCGLATASAHTQGRKGSDAAGGVGCDAAGDGVGGEAAAARSIRRPRKMALMSDLEVSACAVVIPVPTATKTVEYRTKRGFECEMRLTRPFRDTRRSPSPRWYPVPRATRTTSGFVGIRPSLFKDSLSRRAKQSHDSTAFASRVRQGEEHTRGGSDGAAPPLPGGVSGGKVFSERGTTLVARGMRGVRGGRREAPARVAEKPVVSASPSQNSCTLGGALMLNFSMYQSGIDFKCPYSNRPSKPLTSLIGLTQSLFGGT